MYTPDTRPESGKKDMTEVAVQTNEMTDAF